MKVTSAKGNEVTIKEITTIESIENGNGEMISVGVNKLHAILPNNAIANIHSLLAIHCTINTNIGSFAVINNDFAKVENLFAKMNAENRANIKSAKGMTLNPDWIGYNNSENEGAEGYNPHVKYI